ncbi:palindromic element RPE1 domain-containing protein [Candidatus Rickettsia colombianensi]|uniref:palindromic element RPE1 domain-containing protein n=1 Tax=Candidatus Rickettsia colombianensi TaxID=1090944 RepID=UPI000EF24A52|nr:palindromic element RPE1 domain-containing protein [Candidatus Rickettsia colombianensi]
MHNLSYKEEFEGNTERSTGRVHLVCEDASTGLTYKLPLEGGYARSLVQNA